MILAGDIGGTKTNLALFEKREGSLVLHTKEQFASKEFENFSDVIQKFFELTSVKDIGSACFGIAGPIVDGNCRTTNLPWDIRTSQLQEFLHVKDVVLLNDLEATAYGMLHLDDEAFISLNPKGEKKEGNRAVIAAGTGLGEAILFFDGKRYHPIGSEGGHTDFAPNTPQQDELLKWLRKRYREHVSYERVVSGIGIYTIYEFLLDSDFAPQPTAMIRRTPEQDKSALISELALNKGDKLCVETLRLFCEIYGAEAGNLALKSLSTGGVYIGGGIAPKILPFMQKGDFMNAFLAKGRFKELLEKMEVKISLNDETALLGAAYFIAGD